MLTYATMLCQPAPTATPVHESFKVIVKNLRYILLLLLKKITTQYLMQAKTQLPRQRQLPTLQKTQFVEAVFSAAVY
jgi:hypothetical protein